jgi:sugar lactone lactonase YvrE
MMYAFHWVAPVVVCLSTAAALGQIACGQTFTISTVAGVGEAGFSGDSGPATQGELRNPSSVAVAPDGSLYIADLNNGRIRRVDPNGTITTVAGDGTKQSSGDGGPAAAAQLGNAYGVAVDRHGNVFLGDRLNGTVRKISPDGMITRFAGTGMRGFSGDGGPATDAELGWPNDISFDAKGNVYIADASNNRVRVVDAGGKITTFAGTGVAAYSGDGGPATKAELNRPSALCFDMHDAMYICDFNNHSVRKVTPDGEISTIAGTGKLGQGGDGGPATEAQLFRPCGVAVDRQGRVYIADADNCKIRLVRGDGTIDTIAGTGEQGYAGDGGPAREALIAIPDQIDIDAAGNIYISEFRSHVIRKLIPDR